MPILRTKYDHYLQPLLFPLVGNLLSSYQAPREKNIYPFFPHAILKNSSLLSTICLLASLDEQVVLRYEDIF